MASPPASAIPHDGKPVSAIPVGLKEAALDSPTFRATCAHFSEQIDFVEKWLDGYARSAGKLQSELSSLEAVANSFLSHVTAPASVSEAVIDHDYALLALKRHGESARDFWTGVMSTVKKSDALIAEPIRAFIQSDLRAFKETRRTLDQAQKQHDNLQAKYAGQGKSKEPSSLREDAFQLHEARKAYLKASMDFCMQAPQIKNTLDKLLVHVSFDQWREFRVLRDTNSATFNKWGQEMDRIKGWTHEMEASEKSSRRDLLAARKQIEEAAEYAVRPSRELEDYSVSTVPYLGSHGPTSLKMGKDHKFGPEKQGWLNLRILTGKPTRTAWVRRWTFLKHGIFGCLVQGSRTGGVEESERIGVLLCSIRPAFQEERRFCFEVKTKNNTIMLQAETQKELTDWIGSFEAAKRKALESPNPRLSLPGRPPAQDPAFSISQPPAPEFAADISESLTPNANDEPSILDRASSIPVVDRDGLAVRNSTDIGSSRRSTAGDRDIETGKDHAARLIQKLDIHRRATTGLQQSGTSSPQPGTVGIASLISASHSLLPALPAAVPSEAENKLKAPNLYNFRDAVTSTLAPPTLANPPTPTSMSRAAVIVSSETGVGVRISDGIGGVPSGMMANLWGSSNWGLINKLERQQAASEGDECRNTAEPTSGDSSLGQSPTTRHRQTVSLSGAESTSNVDKTAPAIYEYPSYYPAQLKPHDAQFRLLFPSIPNDEPLVLVFRATFSANDQQDFPGRAYVTTRRIYFYSNHFSLVLTSCAAFSSISEVTAAPGRDCDFLFLHIVPDEDSGIPGRITIKTFLEPLKLLQRRLNFLINMDASHESPGPESIFKSLVKMENDSLGRTPSMESWDDLSPNTPADDRPTLNGVNVKRPESRFKPGDKDLDADKTKVTRREIPRFRLPSQPVEYVPQGAVHLSAEKFFDISPKALFHVLFGDKSAVWQLLQLQRRAENIKQGPWTNTQSAHMRRDFKYQIRMPDFFGRPRQTEVSDYQIVDVQNDHLCYVVTDKRTPWHLPFKRYFRLVSKIVITHVSKSRCKLAIFTKVEWLWEPYLIRGIIDKQAMNDLEQDALDLVDLVSEEVKRLGPNNQSKRAISQFGNIGQETQETELAGVHILQSKLRRPSKQSGILHLLLETSGSLLQSAVSSLMIWFWALLRWVWKTCSANSIILLLLVFSVVINGFHSYQDTVEWLQERNAGNFMARLGVGPNPIMSKAVYIRDMDEVIANTTEMEIYNSSACFSTFREDNALRAPDIPWLFTPTSSATKDAKAKSAAQQLQRTRERLGTYRHNLLVALRVVNRIEAEVIQAEWERWLQRETRKCRVVEILLNNQGQMREGGFAGDENEDDGDHETVQGLEKRFNGKMEDVQAWYEEYCMSCRREMERVGLRSW
ncbi:SNF1-interacting protein [Onygenales sp. PD_10]|nr:SNF1-interacting protein [Onygenales sp. PD_10]